MSEKEYRQCTNCVLDTTTKHISFDENGVCNFCHNYKAFAQKFINVPAEKKKKEFDFIISKIKRYGKNRQYDCILGLSGGVDSSYLALLAKRNGLRPLVVHFDNGWNSEQAVKNIERIVNKLGFDLYTYVINWEEFKELQLAYLRASVVDIEVPTDYLIIATLYKIAAEKNIRFILSGYNYVTEYGLPRDWNYSNKTDDANLRNIYTRFGRKSLKDFPSLSMHRRTYYKDILGIESVELLNKIPYVKSEVKKELESELGWQDYGGKHYESLFTRFYQGYILPCKFNIDKRKSHWSSLIWSAQASRQDALKDLANPPYPIELQNEDREFVIKKFDLTEQEFEKIMNEKPVEHAVYGTESISSFSYKMFNGLIYLPKLFLRKYRFIKATGKWKIPAT
jgi:N-acetyl sugar amidotransferase